MVHLRALVLGGFVAAASLKQKQEASKGIGGLLPESLSGLEHGSIGSAVSAGRARVEGALGYEEAADATVLGRIKDTLYGEASPPPSHSAGHSFSDLVGPLLPEEVTGVFAKTAGLVGDAGSSSNKRALRRVLLEAKLLINVSIDLLAKKLETPEDHSYIGDAKNIASNTKNVLDLLRNTLDAPDQLAV